MSECKAYCWVLGEWSGETMPPENISYLGTDPEGALTYGLNRLLTECFFDGWRSQIEDPEFKIELLELRLPMDISTYSYALGDGTVDHEPLEVLRKVATVTWLCKETELEDVRVDTLLYQEQNGFTSCFCDSEIELLSIVSEGMCCVRSVVHAEGNDFECYLSPIDRFHWERYLISRMPGFIAKDGHAYPTDFMLVSDLQIHTIMNTMMTVPVVDECPGVKQLKSIFSGLVAENEEFWKVSKGRGYTVFGKRKRKVSK